MSLLTASSIAIKTSVQNPRLMSMSVASKPVNSINLSEIGLVSFGSADVQFAFVLLLGFLKWLFLTEPLILCSFTSDTYIQPSAILPRVALLVKIDLSTVECTTT